jgi:tetratricopeptide (TPR) repeat protein
MLTGAKAFTGETTSDVIASILMKDPNKPRDLNPKIPAELESITLKMLAKDREQRYSDVGSVLADLESFRRVGEKSAGVHRPGFIPAAIDPKAETLLTGSPRTKHGDTISIEQIASEEHAGSRLTKRYSSIFRPKLFAPLVLGLIAIGLVVYWLSSAGTVAAPKAEAMELYTSGTEALRDGTYYKASKLLEDSIKVDANFPNAHARLAEAWVELDYFGRAEREMLKVRELQRARTGFLTSFTRSDGDLYIDAISATVLRNLPEAQRAYESLTVSNPDDAQAHVDLGRALEKNEEINRAIEAYEKAGQLNGQYGAAFLRLGILKSPQG